MSLLGLLTLNLLFLIAGSGILWGVRGWTTWSEYRALGGIAYVMGLSAVGVLATLVPIWGGSLSGGVIVGICAAVGLAGLAVGAAKRRPRPTRSEAWKPPELSWALLPYALGLLTAVLLAAFFRVARIQPVTSWDSWGFWMTKAKAIYYFGGLDPQLFASLAGPSYPIFIPTLSAMDFRFMGSADTTTLGLQWWLLLVGFVWASAGLLRRIAPMALVWIFLLTAVGMPELEKRLLERTADWPLDIFFALAAAFLLVWIETRDIWLLVPYGLLLSAALTTKREGQLIALCLVIAGVVASGVRARRTWLAVVGVAAVAYLPDIPWRIWFTSRQLLSDAPPGGFVHGTFNNGSRVGPSFELVLRLVFDYHMWLAIAPIAIAAAVLCMFLPDRRPAVFFLTAFALGIAAWAWVNWSDPALPITTQASLNPTNRAVGSLVLLSIVCTPVLVGRLLAQREPREASVPAVASS